MSASTTAQLFLAAVEPIIALYYFCYRNGLSGVRPFEKITGLLKPHFDMQVELMQGCLQSFGLKALI